MCPAVPTITLFVAVVCVAVDLVAKGSSHRFGCYWRKESAVKPKELFCGRDFVDNGLRGGAGIGGSKNRAADNEKIGSRANGLLW